MKRLVLVVACGSPGAPLSAHVAAPPPCPADAMQRLNAIALDACVFGHFPQPGWIVVAEIATTTPDSMAPDQLRALILPDGTIAARAQDEVVVDTKQTLRAIDLDGDGADEIVEDLTWKAFNGPFSGERVNVYRVHGERIDQVATSSISMHDDHGNGCDGRLAITPRQVAIEVTSEPTHDAQDYGEMCLPLGHHVVEVPR